MYTVHDYLRDHLLTTAGVINFERVPDLPELRKSEWSTPFEFMMKKCFRDLVWNTEFIHLMENRLIMGRFRYGKLGEAKGLNRVGSIGKRIGFYLQTGNGEHLVDIANISMMEYVEQNHPSYHWEDVGPHLCLSQLTITSALQHWHALYEKQGNAKWLIHIASATMHEYGNPTHPLYHWKSQDDSYHEERMN